MSGSYTASHFYLFKRRRKEDNWAEVLYYGAQCGYQVGTAHGYSVLNCQKQV
jgi:hypothetical protein